MEQMYMKFYPYSKIKTERLGLLLVSARIITMLGAFCLVLSLLAAISLFVLNGSHDVDAEISMHSTGLVFRSLSIALWGLLSCIGFILVGGIAAAAVAIEQHCSVLAAQKQSTAT
jgi:hypothetical protein